MNVYCICMHLLLRRLIWLLMFQAAAQEGATAPPALEDVVDLHFVALVNQNERLVELDGRKSFPIDHGKTTSTTLLQARHQFITIFITIAIQEVFWIALIV